MVLVIGGDLGIGWVVCYCYVFEGVSVVFIYVKGWEDKDVDEILCLFYEVKIKDVKDFIMIVIDLGFEENCKRIVDEVVNVFGCIDVFVNCVVE